MQPDWVELSVAPLALGALRHPTGRERPTAVVGDDKVMSLGGWRNRRATSSARSSRVSGTRLSPARLLGSIGLAWSSQLTSHAKFRKPRRSGTRGNRYGSHHRVGQRLASGNGPPTLFPYSRMDELVFVAEAERDLLHSHR